MKSLLTCYEDFDAAVEKKSALMIRALSSHFFYVNGKPAKGNRTCEKNESPLVLLKLLSTLDCSKLNEAIIIL